MSRKNATQQSVHLTLGILRTSQAVSHASAFFWLDGFAVPAPAQVTQTVRRHAEKVGIVAKIHYAINSDKDRWSYPFALCGAAIPEGSNVAYTDEDTTCKKCIKLLSNDNLDEMIVSAFIEAAEHSVHPTKGGQA